MILAHLLKPILYQTRFFKVNSSGTNELDFSLKKSGWKSVTLIILKMSYNFCLGT